MEVDLYSFSKIQIRDSDNYTLQDMDLDSFSEIQITDSYADAMQDVDLDIISKTPRTTRYADIMQRVEVLLRKDFEIPRQRLVVKGDPTFRLICECNVLLDDIENEIDVNLNFVQDKYELKFPMLKLLARRPVEYVGVLKMRGSKKTHLTFTDLKGVLNSATDMEVLATEAIMNVDEPLELEDGVLQEIIGACDRVVSLDSAMKRVVDFVECLVGNIAPNLCAVVRGVTAAKLIGTAGGLLALAKMPPFGNQLLEAQINLADFLAGMSGSHVGYTKRRGGLQADYRLVAEKSKCAAYTDCIGADPSGSTGRKLRASIEKVIMRRTKAFKKVRIAPV